MSMGASGHSSQSLMRMRLAKGGAKVSLSICPGTRYHVPSSLLLLLPSSRGFVNVPWGVLQESPWSLGPGGEDPEVLICRAGPLMPTLFLPQIGMGNADYLAAFLHVLLPLAFEVTVWWVSLGAGDP